MRDECVLPRKCTRRPQGASNAKLLVVKQTILAWRGESRKLLLGIQVSKVIHQETFDSPPDRCKNFEFLATLTLLDHKEPRQKRKRCQGFTSLNEMINVLVRVQHLLIYCYPAYETGHHLLQQMLLPFLTHPILFILKL